MNKKREWPVFNQRHRCWLCDPSFQALLIGIILSGVLILFAETLLK